MALGESAPVHEHAIGESAPVHEHTIGESAPVHEHTIGESAPVHEHVFINLYTCRGRALVHEYIPDTIGKIAHGLVQYVRNFKLSREQGTTWCTM